MLVEITTHLYFRHTSGQCLIDALLSHLLRQARIRSVPQDLRGNGENPLAETPVHGN